MAITLISSTFIGGCIQRAAESTESPGESSEETTAPSNWMDMELTDLATAEQFRISDFKSSTILMESVASCCGSGLSQRIAIKEVSKRKGDAIVYISVETDVLTNEINVRKALQNFNFEWYIANAPDEYVDSLVDEVGLDIMNPVFVPVLLICPDQLYRLLGEGIKSADELIGEAEKGCDYSKWPGIKNMFGQ